MSPITEGFLIAKRVTTRTRSVSAFVTKARAVKRVADAQTRLIFALDATASREPTWHVARSLHQSLFEAAAEDTTLALPNIALYSGSDATFAGVPEQHTCPFRQITRSEVLMTT